MFTERTFEISKDEIIFMLYGLSIKDLNDTLIWQIDRQSL